MILVNALRVDRYWNCQNDSGNQTIRRENTILHYSHKSIKKKKLTGWLAKKVIAKLWMSVLDCSPIDFWLQKYNFFLNMCNEIFIRL